MNEKIKTVVRFFIGWPLSIIALFFIGKTIFSHRQEMLSSLQHIQLSLLLLGIVFLSLYFFFRSVFWQKLIQKKGHALSFRDTCFLWGTS
ncbi:MAG: hypothetical protein ACREGI_05060, partial [Candidatus Levyibacteriota bacterium]